MKLDAHQHFWHYDPQEYPWIAGKLKRLRRDYGPEDLARELATAKLEGSIAVQARQTVEESRWLLSLADRHPLIKGVVGWVDLQSDRVEETLAELARHPRFVGVRHVLQDEPDDAFMLRPAFLRGVRALKPFRLAYDLLIFPKHLPGAVKLVEQCPDQKFVVDHLAKPSIRTGRRSPWAGHIRELADHPNVWCKVSGLVTEARWGRWAQADFRPYLDVVFAAFGGDRLMFGSDWPVCLAAADYGAVCGIVQDYLQAFSEEARRRVFGVNAATFYGIL